MKSGKTMNLLDNIICLILTCLNFVYPRFMVPIVAALEYNHWFTSLNMDGVKLVCTSYDKYSLSMLKLDVK